MPDIKTILIADDDGDIREVVKILLESEGFLVEVYETGIRLRGYDFVAGKYLPIAEYFLFTN